MTRAARARRLEPSPVRIVETIARRTPGQRTLYRFNVWTSDGSADRCALTLTAEGPLGRLRALAELEALGYSLEHFEPAEPPTRNLLVPWAHAALMHRLRSQGVL
jgi:hypothetical protein